MPEFFIKHWSSHVTIAAAVWLIVRDEPLAAALVVIIDSLSFANGFGFRMDKSAPEEADRAK